jgi:hypothetical protein
MGESTKNYRATELIRASPSFEVFDRTSIETEDDELFTRVLSGTL